MGGWFSAGRWGLQETLVFACEIPRHPKGSTGSFFDCDPERQRMQKGNRKNVIRSRSNDAIFIAAKVEGEMKSSLEIN